MKMKKLTSVLVFLLLSAMLVFAGGGDEESSSGETLTVWSWGADLEKTVREEMVKIFQKAHPEIKVEHIVMPTADNVWDQKAIAAYAAGNAGDIMQMSPDHYGLFERYHEDLNPFVAKDGIDLNAEVTDGMMDGYYRTNGKLEALPLLANCFVILYNKELFDKAGVPYPTDDWTWQDFADMAPKFVSGEGVNHVYFMANHWAQSNFATLSMGGKPYSDDFKSVLVNSPEVAAGLDLFGNLVKEGALQDAFAVRTMPKDQLFASGKAAVCLAGGFEIATIAQIVGSNFSWGAVLPPKDPSGKNVNITYATGYAMNAAAKNKDAAWTFLKEASFANADMARQTARIGMPANKSVANGEYADIAYGPMTNAMYVKGLATSRLNLWGGSLAEAQTQWTQMWEAVTVGGSSAKDAQAKYFPLVQRAWDALNF
jgi:multiple sugar transport system substrate-binding protein